MKRTDVLSLVLLAALQLCGINAFAQTDSAYLEKARSLLGLKPHCDEALHTLDNVSAAGRLTAPYLLYMAEAHDCKTDREQALYYYNKYLLSDSTSDAVKIRVAELTDQKAREARIEEQAQLAAASYSAAKKTKKRAKKKHLAIDDNFAIVGISYDAATGGANAPYKSGITFSYGANYPIIHRHVLLSYSVYSGFLFGPNNAWFSSVYQAPVSSVSGVGLGLSAGITFTPAAVLVNKRGLAVTAGPLIGLGYAYAPDVNDDYGNAATVIKANDLALTYGAFASIFMGQYFVCSVSYAAFGGRSVTTQSGFGTQSAAVDRDMLHITFGFRFSGWDWYYGYR